MMEEYLLGYNRRNISKESIIVRQLTPEGQEALQSLAQRHGVSTDAARAMLDALVRGNGQSAQFDIPELGGRGQWMRGGMTQVGDMFDHALKAKVDALCSELSTLLTRQSTSAEASQDERRMQSQQQQQGRGASAPGFGTMTSFFGSDVSSSEWWPSGLGRPSAAGSQNTIRYAVFPEARRLALDIDGKITVHDTGDYEISGVSQQQSDRYSLVFTSQKGRVRAADLPVVSPGSNANPPSDPPKPQNAPASPMTPEPPSVPVKATSSEASKGDDAIALIERLAQLRDKGILSEDEFAAKKTELLSRL